MRPLYSPLEDTIIDRMAQEYSEISDNGLKKKMRIELI